MRIARVLEAAVLCTHDDDDDGCLDGVPSIYSRSFSPCWSRLPALDSPAGGLAAAYSGQGWTVFQLPSTSGQLRAVESATEGQDTPDMDSS